MAVLNTSQNGRASFEDFRALVPVAADPTQTYLNASFQPPMSLPVRTAVEQFLAEASTHPDPKPAWQMRAVETQSQLASYLNVPATSLAFTRDTTEGLNLFQRSLNMRPGDNIVVLEEEHPNQVYGWLALADQGLEIRRVAVDDQVDHGFSPATAETFVQLVDERTIAIGLSSIMFHNGQMNHVADISAAYRPRGIHVLVDMTQHVGVATVDLTAWNVSAAAFGCHKGLAAPTGLGCLYINPNVLGSLKTPPPLAGAGAIANLPATLVADPNVKYWDTTKRYEHLNVSLSSVAALSASLALITQHIGTARLEQYLRFLGRDLTARCVSLGVEVLGSSSLPTQQAPHIYVLRLMHHDWKAFFREQNIYVSHYRCGVRISLGFYNNLEDIDVLVRCVKIGLAKGIPVV